VEKGEEDIADVWLTMANGMYGSDPRLARDEAIRSGSLAAMTLMLAAGNRGYVSCPIGFNPVQVMEIKRLYLLHRFHRSGLGNLLLNEILTTAA